MAAIILLSLVLVAATFCIHLASFTFLARSIPMGERASHLGLFLLMMGIFAAHIVEIIIYALGFYVAMNIFGLGLLEGERGTGFLGLFYTSAVFYTSLGFGDVLPNDHLRFLAGIEALNGLLLIAWSASFLFAAMGHFWHCLTGEKFSPGRNGETSSYDNIAKNLHTNQPYNPEEMAGKTQTDMESK